MAKLKEGQKVVFTFKGVNRVGIIESIKIINKSKKYQVRDERGKLFPYLGVNTVEPGKINVPLTIAYFSDSEEQEGVLIGSEGDTTDEQSTK